MSMSSAHREAPVRSCARCESPAVRLQGHQWLCAMHYRFGQMRARAKRDGKTVPTLEQLHLLIEPGNPCRDCRTPMNWLSADNRTRVATLQHYRDSTFGLVCRSCNTRHAFMPGDTFRDMPSDHKLCPKCGDVKPFSDFSKDNGRSGPMKLKSWCRACASTSHSLWRQGNRGGQPKLEAAS